MPLRPGYDAALIHRGKYFTAEWYYTAEGIMPGFDYYEELDEIDRDRFDDLTRYLCETRPGSILPKTIYRIEDRAERIYALKPRAERFFNFTTAGAKIILTNAYHKHSQRMGKGDMESLKFSVRCKRDYFRRLEEGTYYEI